MGAEQGDVFRQPGTFHHGSQYWDSLTCWNSRNGDVHRRRKTANKSTGFAPIVPAIPSPSLLICIILLTSVPSFTVGEADSQFDLQNSIDQFINATREATTPIAQFINATREATRPIAQFINATQNATRSFSFAPQNFAYTSLWVSPEGSTHLQECNFSNFTLEIHANLPQFVRRDFGGSPTRLSFTEQPIFSPPHNPPSTQFVIVTHGRWHVTTTNGTRREFGPGEVLYQENVEGLPTPVLAQHTSGVVGFPPCYQVIVQTDRTPSINDPCPFSR